MRHHLDFVRFLGWYVNIYIYVCSVSSCLGFTNENLWRGFSTSTVDTMWLTNPMRDMQASLTTVTAFKGTGWHGCWSFLILPPPVLHIQDGPVGVLKGEDNLMDGVAPGLTVSSKCRILVVVNMACTEGYSELDFIPFLWCPFIKLAREEFAVRGYLRQAMILPLWRRAHPRSAVTSATCPRC